MTPGLLVGLALAGGVGAVTRFVLDGVIRGRTRSVLPLGTIAINLSGSLALGLVVGLVDATVVPEGFRAVVGTGFLGGYTTFSAASVEVLRLVEGRHRGAAALTGGGQLVASLLLAALGLALTAR